MMINQNELDIIIPISFDLDWPSKESIICDIKEQNEKYGFSRFALAAPCGGWRSIGFPPKKFFEERARFFLDVKNEISLLGIECGWWITLTMKSGPTKEWTRPVMENGEEYPIGTCPMDENFVKTFCESVALFAKIAKPAFIITEDDFTIPPPSGCYCEMHLNEFAKRQGRYYSRKELVNIFKTKTPGALELLRAYRELTKDVFVNFASEIRRAVDVDSPEIPIGYMQPSASDKTGDCTQDVAEAMAGDKHTPFSRLFGAFYGEAYPRCIPEVMHHPLYSRQHIKGEFKYYFESDTFPHTRFFQSAKSMNALMSAAYSYGFIGSTFQTQQLLDNANEEKAYGTFYAKERKRLNALMNTVKECKLNGVNIEYDPFYNTVDNYTMSPMPHWTRCIGNFGIPFTTLESSINFWDERQARYYDDEKILKALSGNLFLDGAAAKWLSDRGYSKYIGVKVGDDVLGDYDKLQYDLGAREVISEKFRTKGEGQNMPSAHMFSPNGNGKLLRLTPISENCEVISELYTYDKKLVSPAMTRFENSLGGKVVVLGETLYKNVSQSLLNYRRQRLMQNLIQWCADDYALVKDDPCVYTIQNEATNPETSGFSGMLTLINLCEDELERVYLHLPEKWKNAEFMVLDENGVWQSLDTTKTNDGIIVNEKLNCLEPMYILIK